MQSSSGEAVCTKPQNRARLSFLTVIFSSPREGGFGNIDVYIVFKRDNGEWTDGINMGSDINSKGFELAPYISRDDKLQKTNAR